MFLLNNGKVAICRVNDRFTIQNVPIKYSQRDVFSKADEKFTIQNVPIK